MFVVIRGAGDIASGVALRLRRAGIRVLLCDLERPTAIRRTVCFSEAIRLGETEVEGVSARRCPLEEVRELLDAGIVPVLADPEADCVPVLRPDAVVDAILAKRNLMFDLNTKYVDVVDLDDAISYLNTLEPRA